MSNVQTAPGQVRAVARFVRVAPDKVRQVAAHIRGRDVTEAHQLLQFSPKGAALPLRKVLDSAVANAEHNNGLDPEDLIVTAAVVDEGPTLRRFRPRAMGRAYRINKRTCHITVVVGPPETLGQARGAQPARAAAPATAIAQADPDDADDDAADAADKE